VQAHHAPVRVLEQRIVGDQSLPIQQRTCDLALGLELRGDSCERIASRDGPLLARDRDPVGEFKTVVEVQVSQQFAGGGIRILLEPRAEFPEVVRDPGSQRQRDVRNNDIALRDGRSRNSAAAGCLRPLVVRVRPRRRAPPRAALTRSRAWRAARPSAVRVPPCCHRGVRVGECRAARA
jgi:hypothetical protein